MGMCGKWIFVLRLVWCVHRLRGSMMGMCVNISQVDTCVSNSQVGTCVKISEVYEC